MEAYRDDETTVTEQSANMAQIAASERGEDSETILAEERAARDRHSRFTVTARRRVRHWTDGVVIGSELFVREIAVTLFGPERAKRKRLARGIPPDPAADLLFSYRRLDPDL